MIRDLVQLTDCRHVAGYRVWLRFDDGLEGEIDLTRRFRGRVGPVFQPLKDPAYFARFRLIDTISWPNGADLAPESLYRRLKLANTRRKRRAQAPELASHARRRASSKRANAAR